MKFSKRKKEKMRKYRQRRVNRYCSHMIGCTVDYEKGCYVIDQAKIDNTMYLLTQDSVGEYAIYKIVSVHDEVRLSPKRVLQNQKAFSNYQNWEMLSRIEISSEGKIKSVKYENPRVVPGTIRLYIYIS